MFYPISQLRLNSRNIALCLIVSGLLTPVASLTLHAAPANVSSARPELVLQLGHAGDAETFAISPDGRTIATGGKDQTVKLWDAQSGSLKRTLIGLGNAVSSVQFSKDGRSVFATNSSDSGRKEGGKVVTWNVTTGEQTGTIKGADFIGLTAFSPDQKVMARVQWWSDNPYAGHQPGTITLHDAQNGKLLRTLTKEKLDATMLSFSRDGANLAAANTYGGLRVWNLRTGQLRRIATNRLYFNAMTITPDGRSVIVSGSKLDQFNTETGPNQLRVYDVASGKLVKTLSGSAYKLAALTFSRDGKTLLCIDNGTVVLRDAGTFAPIRSLDDKSIFATQVAFSPDGKSVFAVGIIKDPSDEYGLTSDNRTTGIMQWDRTTGRAVKLSKCSSPVEYGFEVKPLADGQSLSLLTDRKSISILDARTLKRKFAFKDGGASGLYGFSADASTLMFGKQVGFSSFDWRVWTLNKSTSGANYSLKKTISNVNGSIRSNGNNFSHDGKLLLAVYRSDLAGSGSVILWNLNSYKRQTVQLSESNAVDAVAFSPDDSTVALGTSAGSVNLWNVKTGELTGRFLDHQDSVNHVQYSPDGKTILTSDGAEVIRQWDVQRQVVAHSWPAHNTGLLSLSYSADGERIVSSGGDGFIKVWDAKTGQEIRAIQSASPYPKAFLLNDAKTLVQVGTDQTLTFWNVATGDLLLTYQLLPNTNKAAKGKDTSKITEATWVAFTPDGFYDASPGADKFIRWRLGNNILPAANYVKTNRRADLIAQVLKETN